MYSGEAAEAVVKMSLEGTEVALKIAGAGAKNIAVMLYTMLKDNKMTKGKVKLNDMLKSGNALQIFSLKKEDLKKFNEQAKGYGILYTVLAEKNNDDGMVDLLVRDIDAVRVNHIIERFKLTVVDVATIKKEIEKDKNASEIESNGKTKEENLADDIMLSKPKENNDINPNLAKTEKNPLSEHSLESKNDLGVASENEKPSVKKELKEITDEIKKKEKNPEVKHAQEKNSKRKKKKKEKSK